jgi:hypothetical protein
MSTGDAMRLALDTLRKGLSEPYPTDCVFTLIGCLHSLSPDDLDVSNSDHRPLAISYAVSTITTRWATYPRSVESVKRIAGMSCKCADVELQDNQWHAEGNAFYARIRRESIGLYFAHLTLMDLGRLFHRGVKHLRALHKMARQERWPRFPRDVISHGLEDTYRGLLSWLSLKLHPDMIGTINLGIMSLANLCQSTYIPYLATSTNFLEGDYVCLVENLISWSSNRSDTEPLANRYPHVNRLLIPIARIAHDAIAEGMNEVQRSFFARPDFRFLVATGRAVDLCFRMIAFFKQSGNSDQECQAWIALGYLGQVGARIYETSARARTVRVSDNARSGFEGSLKYMKNPRDRLLRALSRLASCRACMSPGCANVVLEGRIQCCAGCLRVPYCSRKCQRRAWIHEAAPHRSVCADIRQLCLRLDLPRDRRMLDREVKLREKTLPTDAPWDRMALAVVEHFLNISRYEARINRERRTVYPVKTRLTLLPHAVYRTEAEWYQGLEA